MQCACVRSVLYPNLSATIPYVEIPQDVYQFVMCVEPMLPDASMYSSV